MNRSFWRFVFLSLVLVPAFCGFAATVTVIAPTNNASVNSPVTVQATINPMPIPPPSQAQFAFYAEPGHTYLSTSPTVSAAGNSSNPYSYTWTAPGAGNYSVICTSLKTGDSSSAVSFTVNATYQKPTANSQTVNTNYNTAVAITLSGSDPNPGGVISSYQITTAPSNGQWSGTLPHLTYTPNTSFSGTDSFYFTVTDNYGQVSNAAKVTINVCGTLIGGVTDGATLTTRTVSFTGSAALSSLPDYYTIYQEPAHTALTQISTQPTTYPAQWTAPAPGSYSAALTTTACGTSALVHFTILDNAPVATGTPIVTNENVPVQFTLPATDQDNDPLTSTIVTSPSHGQLSSGNGMTRTYTPNPYYHGSDSFQFYATDPYSMNSTTVTVPITVNFVNQPPTYNWGTDQTVNENCGAQTVNHWATNISPGPNQSNESVQFHLSNDNNTLFSAQPSIDAATGNLYFTPATNASGSTIVTVTLQNNGGTQNGGQDTSAPHTFTITVNWVNQPPYFDRGADQVVNENAGPQTATNWATHISPGPPNQSNESVWFAVSTNNPLLFATPPAIDATTGTLTYTPGNFLSGVAIVTATLYNSGGTANGGHDSYTQTFTITVNKVVQPPTAVNDNVLALVNSTGITIPVLANDSDPQGEALTVTGVGTASNGGTPTVNNGVVSYVLAQNFLGTDSFSYTISNTDGGSATATVTVQVVSLLPISSTACGQLGDGASWGSALSGDGSTVAFISTASNLDTPVTNGYGQVFAKLPAVGIPVLISRNASGAAADGDCADVALSNNGISVAFSSTADNLVVATTNATAQIYLVNLQTSQIQLISRSAGGMLANGPCWGTAVSADGNTVAFLSDATNLTPDGNNGATNVYLYTVSSGTLMRVPLNLLGPECGSGVRISADGQHVVFDSTLPQVSGVTNGFRNVYVYDLTPQTAHLVSVASSGTQANADSWGGTISQDGSQVAYVSTATNLDPTTDNGLCNAYLYNRQTGVNACYGFPNANGDTWEATISANGNDLLLTTNATNQGFPDTNGVSNVMLYDFPTQMYWMLSTTNSGQAIDGDSWGGSISANGRFITFTSQADNIVINDTNNASDVFPVQVPSP